jgi:hypothetical protein
MTVRDGDIVRGELIKFTSDPATGLVVKVFLDDVIIESGANTKRRYLETLIISVSSITYFKLADEREQEIYRVALAPMHLKGYKYDFPKTGWCKKPTADLIAYLNARYDRWDADSVNKPGGIVWSSTSFWGVEMFSNYPEYPMEELKYLIPNGRGKLPKCNLIIELTSQITHVFPEGLAVMLIDTYKGNEFKRTLKGKQPKVLFDNIPQGVYEVKVNHEHYMPHHMKDICLNVSGIHKYLVYLRKVTNVDNIFGSDSVVAGDSVQPPPSLHREYPLTTKEARNIIKKKERKGIALTLIPVKRRVKQ